MNPSARMIDLDLGLPARQRPSLVTRIGAALRTALRFVGNRQAANRIADLDDSQLADIGLTRDDVDRILNTSGLTDDPSRQLARIARERARAALAASARY